MRCILFKRKTKFILFFYSILSSTSLFPLCTSSTSLKPKLNCLAWALTAIGCPTVCGYRDYFQTWIEQYRKFSFPLQLQEAWEMTIPHWVLRLLTLELHHTVESMPVLDPKMHWAKFLSNVSGDCYKHAQTCNRIWKD